MSRTDFGIVVRMCYAVSGTDLGCPFAPGKRNHEGVVMIVSGRVGDGRERGALHYGQELPGKSTMRLHGQTKCNFRTMGTRGAFAWS
eukprot:550059-Rhodomonas_salina.2